MFEITGDHIAELNDEDLRSLIGLLCEAEMRRRRLPVSAVTWGGNQNAKDAGLDVRVALPADTIIDGFIPRASTGFQVKKSDMPRGAILDEMKPGGVVRPSIVALTQESGAYIIVSADGSTADVALNNRRDAMAEAMQGVAASDKLALDFLDRGRLATWVRDHAGIIPWVRERIGKSIPGWRAYGAWSHAPDAKNADYIIDDAAKIQSGSRDEGEGLSAIDGINRIRDVLRNPGQVVRLVGLSGVGKTRLLEALFDGTIGTNSLDPALAAYTNVADIPDPQPPALASDLLAEKRRMIFLVIDNCPATLHERLSQIVRVTGSTLSVITVEYDIREDQPEGTDVFTLEVSSVELIEKLVARRFPQLSQVDCRTIAEFSGGNARIAIALAGTVEKDETVSGLNDAELFRRLFHQRHAPDDSLLLIAQACALLYSFQGDDLNGGKAELPILGGLIGKTADEMYRGVAELRRRDLLQQRSEWRAILPHGIANRLAAMALQNIPPQKIEAALVKGASERVLRSFSRRLGFLDMSKEARAIVTGWLAPGGLLADVLNLNDLGRAVFNNIAPVMPEAVLFALENAVGKADIDTLKRSMHFIRLIRSLAYDAAFFERAVALLLKLFAVQSDDQHEDDAGSVISSLCFIVLSGTHATPAQRLALIEGLLRSIQPELQALGIKSLDAMFQSDHFSSSYVFEFGARSRDHGYYPKNDGDIENWYGPALRLAEELANSDLPTAERVKSTIASNIRGLWVNAGRGDDIDRITRAFASKGFWRDGWVNARHTRVYASKQITPDSLDKLKILEEFLRPKDLVAKVRGLVLEGKSGVDYDDFEDIDDLDKFDFAAAEKRAATATEHLGKDVANDAEAFKALLPDFLGGGGRLGIFGAALAKGADNPRELWDALVSQLAKRPDGNFLVMSGFLTGLQKADPTLCEAILDDALVNPTLAPWFPALQASVVINDNGIARIYKSLELGHAPLERYSQLAYGRASDPIPGPAFRDLVIAIAERGGMDAALHMVSMRIFADRTGKRTPLPETLEAGCKVLAKFELGNSKRQIQREDHELGSLAKSCLVGSGGEEVARLLIRLLKAASEDYKLRAQDYDDLVQALFSIQPAAMLDEMFTGDNNSIKVGIHYSESLSRHRSSPLGGVSPETIIVWCELNPGQRYPVAAAVGVVFKKEDDKSPLAWTPLAYLLLQNAPDPKAMLTALIQRLNFNGWSGSWSSKMEGRVKLLDSLDVGNASELQKIKAETLAGLTKQVEEAKKKEAEEDRQRSATFE